MEIICAEDCESKPRGRLLKQFNIAYALGDVESCLQAVTDDIVFEMVGENRVVGKEALRETIAMNGDDEPSEMEIHNIICQGTIAAVNATITMGHGTRYGFCHVYAFTAATEDAKIKEITSYYIEI